MFFEKRNKRVAAVWVWFFSLTTCPVGQHSSFPFTVPAVLFLTLGKKLPTFLDSNVRELATESN